MEKIKICLVGDSQTGKTSIKTRLLFNSFEEIKNDKDKKYIKIEDKNYLIQITDSQPEESIQEGWFSLFDIIICVYSIIDEKSFLFLEKEIKTILTKQVFPI
jgi:GTPase SAR1 family protein